MASGKKNTTIRAILFDLDNTLIATRKADKLTCNKIAEILWDKYSIPIDVATNISSSYLRAFRKCPENPSMDLDTWRHLLWSQALGDQYNQLAVDVYRKWIHLRYHYLSLTPEVQNLLVSLRQNYLIGLITNGPSYSQWEKVQRLNLKSFFDIILVSGDLPWEKPHHKIFHKACKYLGLGPEQCMMVGDKLETDILGGIQANLGSTVWVPLSNKDIAQNDLSPDFIIENVTDLVGLLPTNPKALGFRSKPRLGVFNKRVASVPDLDDCNSNSSDGS